ncbi:TIGR02611 family protein [Rhodococcoides corynebacterioides]|uniref:TIGR02611 family protein n=1 Tax=Rhodococcoides corynebacterioides TaxID=53972 RepID=UPI001C9B535A|nr:TIGR02611 family protein [Rhodococcus corynebacterioides]MBY6350039.1 TIGR02611 family protein [Rhodococcus corynebacterioides]MBY6362033.1 TIGR02611 family protein [Rhodococcus corynebacterioides]
MNSDDTSVRSAPSASRRTREPSKYRRWRDGLASRPTVDRAYRIGVGVVGTLVLAVGIVAIPYPGPGWLIVFAGLGILASEFAWAKTVLRWVRARYDAFMAWFEQQNIVVKGIGVLFTAAVVVATLWVLGALELAGGWVGLDWAWLQSPL